MKKYSQNLKLLRKKIKISSEIETNEINYVLKWLKKRNHKSKMKVKKININKLKDWHIDNVHLMTRGESMRRPKTIDPSTGKPIRRKKNKLFND